MTFNEFLHEHVGVDETPQKKALRISRDYTNLITVDAVKLKQRFELDHGEPLDWNPRRMHRLSSVGTFDAYPHVFLDHQGRIEVLDGRHRLATAAARNQKITIATPEGFSCPGLS